MSLDLYIISKTPVKHKGTGVWVRENGQNKELSPEEAKERFPNNEFPEFETEDDEYWHSNITSNLRKMSEQCTYNNNGIEYSLYRMLWHPEETGLLDDGNVLTKEYVAILLNLLNELQLHKDKYEMYNPANGWGSYDTLYNFVDSLMTSLISINNNDYKNYTVVASY